MPNASTNGWIEKVKDKCMLTQVRECGRCLSDLCCPMGMFMGPFGTVAVLINNELQNLT